MSRAGPNAPKSQILSLEAIVSRVHDQWVTQDYLLDLVKSTAESINDDLEALQKGAAFIYTQDDVEDETEQTVELIRRWHYLNRAPSLAAMCMNAIEGLGLELSEQTLKAVLVASILGEVENDNPYHNNLHFKKVLLQTIRMAAAHNEIYQGTSQALGDDSVALLLLAACIHDIGHDGKGNMVKGMFIQGRLELQSFELARPYLEAAGYSDPGKLEYLKTMLLCTDTSPLGEFSNPMNQMKAAYRYHFLGDKAKTHALNLDPEFGRLPKDAALTLMCLILHEADIATSAGLSYAVTKYETTIFMRELRDDDAYPEQVLDFLNQVCQRKMLSDAGQRLYAANLARIYALAEEDVKAGNHAFPDAQHAELILGIDGSHSKTIN